MRLSLLLAQGVRSAPLTWPEAVVVVLFLVFCGALLFGGPDE